MILELRARHRRIWLVLAVLLPAIFAVAWRTRARPVTMDRIPAALRQNPAAKP